jgi:hypothetical protein
MNELEKILQKLTDNLPRLAIAEKKLQAGLPLITRKSLAISDRIHTRTRSREKFSNRRTEDRDRSALTNLPTKSERCHELGRNKKAISVISKYIY